MLVFAIDTATLQGSYGFVELSSTGEVLGHTVLSAPAAPGHAETALHRMTEVLSFGGFSLRDIELLVFGRGPGTFTGVRIGLSTVKGIAMASEAPVIGVSSLEALAFSSGRTGLVAPLIDARRKELFGALYEVLVDDNGWPSARCIMDERVDKAEVMTAAIRDASGGVSVGLLGNGVAPYRDVLTNRLEGVLLPETTWTPSPFWMARIGHARYVDSGPDDLDTVEPVYIRAPDARLPAVKQR